MNTNYVFELLAGLKNLQANPMAGARTEEDMVLGTGMSAIAIKRQVEEGLKMGTIETAGMDKDDNPLYRVTPLGLVFGFFVDRGLIYRDNENKGKMGF